VNGQPVIQGQSCYHIAHPNLCTPCTCNTNEKEDDQLEMIVASSSSSSDASPLRAH
jgi:hypothetical protein